MAIKMIKRGAISSAEISDVLDKVSSNSITKQQGADIIGSTTEEFDKLYNIRNKETKSAISSLRGPNDYDMDVQKMISYKGVIRPLTVSVKNRNGGVYKMRIINIYVKPNGPKQKRNKTTGLMEPVVDADGRPIIKEYTRNYEEKVYDVDKKKIASGKNVDYYYPEKARWSKVWKTPNGAVIPTNEPEPTPALRKKVKSALLLKRLKKTVKPQNKRKCRCTKK